MANVDRPRGLFPIKHMNGNPYNGETNFYYVPATDSTAIFIGDLVVIQPGADPTGKYPVVTQAAAGATLCAGVVTGFGDNPSISANIADRDLRYRPASTAKYLTVVDDPDVIFEIQEVSGGTALTAAAVGLNAPIVVGSGNTVTGLSGMELNNVGESALAQELRILRLAPGQDNELGEHAKWWVQIADHFFRQALGAS